MKKGKNYYDDEIYEEDEYYDDDEDYDDGYQDYEEEEKPKKKSNQNQQNNNNNKYPNKKNQKNQKNQNQNKENKDNKEKNIGNKDNKINSMDLSKKDSNISLSVLSPSSSSSLSMSQMSKEIKEKEKKIKSILDLNTIESYPIIDYGSKYSPEEEKPTINLVIIGHVDSGKSTMIGHLLYLLNLINKKDFQKTMKLQNIKGTKEKDLIQYAFATDESSSERERGVTIDIGFKNFETKNYKVIALDAPGHRDFIPNMISGTSAADFALLVIDSGVNAFNAGFYSGGQTKEHALLAKTLGVNKLIVAVNKLELLNWNQKRYDEIVTVLTDYLINELGFNEKDITFLPTSGFTGDNLIKQIDSKNANWYTGPTLIDIIDSLPPPPRAINSPVRFIINDVTKNPVNGLQGLNLYGKLDSGIISTNTEYIILPSGNKEKIKTIAVNKNKVNYIIPGQQAEILLNINKNEKEIVVESGNILSSVKYAIPCIKKFKAHIKTYDLKSPITLGQKMMLYLQGQKAQIVIKKIERIFNEGSKVSRNNTKFIPKNFYADVVIHSDDIICAELFKLNKKLATFALRINGDTQAMGYITEFLE